MSRQSQIRPGAAKEAAIQQTISPIIGELLERANLQSGERILILDCGSGDIINLAAEKIGPRGWITGIDVVYSKVAEARTNTASFASVNVIHGNAQNYQFAEHAYDVVLSAFGISHLADPSEAFRNVLKATKPAGRLACVAWSDRRHNPWFSASRWISEKSLAGLPRATFDQPGPLALADRVETARCLRIAGWKQVAVEEVGLHLTPPGSLEDVSELAYQMSMAPLVRRHAANQLQADEMSEICQRELAENLRQFSDQSEMRIPARVNFISARRGPI